MLMTYGHVFVCCLATSLGITIHCDTAIRLKSVRCVLAVFKLLPICCARLNKKLVSTLRPKSAHWVPITIGFFPIHCLFVLFRWERCIALIFSRHLNIECMQPPVYPAFVAPTTIGVSIRRVPMAFGLIPICCGMGIHLSWVFPPPTSTASDSFLVNHLDVPWVGFSVGDKRMDLTFPPFPSWLLCWPWIRSWRGSSWGWVYSPNHGSE